MSTGLIRRILNHLFLAHVDDVSLMTDRKTPGFIARPLHGSPASTRLVMTVWVRGYFEYRIYAVGGLARRDS